MRLTRAEAPWFRETSRHGEPESDGGAVENNLVDGPAIGDVYPAWRLR